MKLYLIFGIAMALLLAGCIQSPKTCTEEAKQCPDGSAVGRTGPNCSFAPCPGEHICTAEEKSAIACTLEYMPVCGNDNITYGNGCGACAGNATSYFQGECKPSNTGMANPASTNCVDKGGTLEIRDTPDGQVGYCKFPNGKECEEWAYFRGECGSK